MSTISAVFRSVPVADAEPPDDHGGVDIALVPSARACTVVVRGEVDSLTAAGLRVDLHGVLDRADLPRDLLLDLRQVTFLSAAGLAVLADVRRTAEGDGRVLRLRCGLNRAVIRPLQVVGLWAFFEVVDA